MEIIFIFFIFQNVYIFFKLSSTAMWSKKKKYNQIFMKKASHITALVPTAFY